MRIAGESDSRNLRRPQGWTILQNAYRYKRVVNVSGLVADDTRCRVSVAGNVPCRQIGVSAVAYRFRHGIAANCHAGCRTALRSSDVNDYDIACRAIVYGTIRVCRRMTNGAEIKTG